MMDTLLMAVSGAHCRGPWYTPAIHPALSHNVSISCVRRHTSNNRIFWDIIALLLCKPYRGAVSIYSVLARPVLDKDNSYRENAGEEECDT
jgi:hypothetical protein